jgi:signal transduction histidine kinase/CheY-like chemotaxis protein
MEQGITVLDTDFRLTCWNRRFRNLLDLPDEMGQVGVSLVQILNYLADRGEIQLNDEASVIDRISRFGEPWQLELARSGKIIEIRSNPMPDGGLVATYSDITDRVHAAIELEKANENLEMRVARRTAELTTVNAELAKARVMAEEANLGKTRFLAAAGHDILQPLNAARLYCSALMDKIKNAEPIELTENLNSSLDSVEAILGAVLDISRLDTGALKPDNHLFRLDTVLRQIETDFLPLANEKKLELKVVESTVSLFTDRNLLRRLIQNLVSNAIKYTRSGRILIGVRRRGAFIEIQVHDTGIGIAENEKDLVFGEFKRLDSGAREATGLGLGLSIVDRIARVLDLKVSFESIVGGGSHFSVTVPIAESQVPMEVRSVSITAPATMNLAGLLVICIDNDPRILDGMGRLLEGWGCEVITATDSLTALASIQSGRLPSVILADYHLDNENGIDVIKQIRERFAESIPAVLLTADRSNEVKARAADAGISVLNKPIKPAALRLVLRQVQLVREAAE